MRPHNDKYETECIDETIIILKAPGSDSRYIVSILILI